MDDLHDAIENARYEECISEAAERKIPSPILPWPIPTSAELEDWKVNHIMAKYKKAKEAGLLENQSDRLINAEPFTLEWTLGDSIGFFLFCTYVWDMKESQYKAMFDPPDNATKDNEIKNKAISGDISAGAISNADGGSDFESNNGAVSGLPKESTVSATPSEDVSVHTRRFHRSSYPDEKSFREAQMAIFDGRYAQIKFLIDVVRFQRVVRQHNDGDSAAKYVLVKKMQHIMDRYVISGTYQGKKSLDHLGKDYDDIARLGSGRRVSLASGENVHPESVVGVFRKNVEKEDGHWSSRSSGASYKTSMDVNTKPGSIDMSDIPMVCCLGIGGKPLIDTIVAVQKGEPYGVDLFDNLETYVVATLKHLYWDSFRKSRNYTRFLHFLWYREKKVVEDDFIPIRKLGRGGFGLVNACKKGTSGKLYAIKAMHKKRVKIKKAEKLILNERIVLASIDCPFVVNLKYAFQSNQNIFLVLDLMTGGDLSYHLSQRGRFTIKECRYYASCIMLGVQALHNQNIVYRDLKPENILMGDDGRVKITDMGLACKITAGLHGACGTRGYWAPEMLRRDSKGKRKSYGHTVDWFSFGCMIAEFISGINPFRSQKALNFGQARGHTTKEKALDCATLEMEPEFDPSLFDANAADLCKKLLNKDETERIGSLNGCRDIMIHEWFHGMNWDGIISNTETPPFLPAREVNAAAQSVIGEFQEDKVFRNTVLDEQDMKAYINWDWTNPAAYGSEVVEFLAYERKLGRPLVPLNYGDGCCCNVS